MNFKVTFKEETPPFNVKFGWDNGEYEAGKAEGAKSEYDRFWDGYQLNGAPHSMLYKFYGKGWTQDTFRPKYDIVPTVQSEIFAGSDIEDIRPQTIGVNVDFSRCTGLNYLCRESSVAYIGVIDCSSATQGDFMLTNARNLVSVEKIIMPENMTWAGFADKSFENAKKLEHIRIEGVIRRSTSLRWSVVLKKESFTSIINALSDTATDQTITFSKAAKEAAFTDSEWAALIGTKPNWTIALA